MYGALPKIERSFDFSAVGEMTGFKYDGVFTIKSVLDIQGKHLVELEKNRLLGGHRNPSYSLVELSATLAELHIRILDYPAWWKDCQFGAELLDEEILRRLFELCIEKEEEWRVEMKQKAQESLGNAQTESQTK